VTHDHSEVLPKGWCYVYVSDDLGYCPTRVWGLDELSDDHAMANLYAQGNRWVVVFSDATGPGGDRTFIHIDSFDAGAMMDNRLNEADALWELADMGYRLQDLPDGIQLAPVALPVQGWYADRSSATRSGGGMAAAGHRMSPTLQPPTPIQFDPHSGRMWRWCWTKLLDAEND
jgi:hypothetical protein